MWAVIFDDYHKRNNQQISLLRYRWIYALKKVVLASNDAANFKIKKHPERALCKSQLYIYF